MMDDLNPTTRMYPRSTRDAFQHLGEGSQWFYPPDKPIVGFWDIVVGGGGILLWIIAAYLIAA
jgi:hypothetical protein